jgi:hypothetical protein
MVSMRKLATVAAAAAIGGSLLGAVGPAAAVEAHSGIQPWMNGSYQSSRAWGGGRPIRAGDDPLRRYQGIADPAVGGAVGGIASTPMTGCNDKATMYMCNKVDHSARH